MCPVFPSELVKLYFCSEYTASFSLHPTLSITHLTVHTLGCHEHIEIDFMEVSFFIVVVGVEQSYLFQSPKNGYTVVLEQRRPVYSR